MKSEGIAEGAQARRALSALSPLGGTGRKRGQSVGGRGAPAAGSRPSLSGSLLKKLVFSSALCAAIAAAGVWVAGELLFESFYDRAARESISRATDRLAAFDHLAAAAERGARETGLEALSRLGGRYRNLSDLEGVDQEALAVLARELGVSELYFIDRGGVVAATSFAPDLGFDLYAASGAPFAATMMGLYGSGRYLDQRLSQSYRTGTINSYQYFSPAGSDMIIEVSTTLEAAMAAAGGGMGFQDLVRFMHVGTAPGADGVASLVDFIGLTGDACWSISGDGKRADGFLDAAREAERRGIFRERSGSTELLVVPFAFKQLDFSIGNTKRFAVIEIDRSPLLRFRLLALLACAAASAIAIAVVTATAAKRTAKCIAGKTRRLEETVRRAASGCVEEHHIDSIEIELEEATRGIIELGSTMRERSRELDTVKAEREDLRRELSHRLGNGLQIIQSLINLRLASAEGCAERASLAALRNELHGMAAAYHATRWECRTEAIHLLPLLEGVARYVCAEERTESPRFSVAASGTGPTVPSESAAPLAVAAAEIITDLIRRRSFGDGKIEKIRIDCVQTANVFRVEIGNEEGSCASGEDAIGLKLASALVGQAGASVEFGDRVVILIPTAAPALADAELAG